ncbi:hypothetical protein [Xenorhabdus sp. TH1]|uniref:hypothetical protein n=1 Tax=Xenorhabdus sp. TH1 TaxID=3130166 RepID=UPI0030D15526
MAVKEGNVSSKIVKETEFGSKLGLYTTFKPSDFIGKSQGFKLTFGSAKYNYDIFDVYTYGVVLDTDSNDMN